MAEDIIIKSPEHDISEITIGDESTPLRREIEKQDPEMDEEDKNDEIPKKRNIFMQFFGLYPTYRYRYLRANDPLYNRSWNYCGNSITTSRYNIITFLPKNLFEQFQRVANIYFVILLILQLIPQISSLTPITTIIPLVFVLSVTLIKDGVDDLFRHISDYKINNRKVEVLTKTVSYDDYGNPLPIKIEMKLTKWANVHVGDIIRLERDNFVPADLFILSSSEPNSLCYVETAELDGETNLKVKSSLQDTAVFEDNIQQLIKFKAQIKTEAPNNILTKFQGFMSWQPKGEKESLFYPINNDNILLRGYTIRNTKWTTGIVIFAGPDTKLRQNSGSPRTKRTKLDNSTNYYVFFICILLLATVSLMTIGNGVWEWLYGQYFDSENFLPYDPTIRDKPILWPSFTAFLNFFSNLIILNTFIPISLYVTVELIRLGQSILIAVDHKMYYKPLDRRARARSTNLSEELGNIEYIFSDKTGTLTENIMTLMKCSVGGQLYGFLESDFDDDYHDAARDLRIDLPQRPPAFASCDLSWNHYKDENKLFYDQTLVTKIHSDMKCLEADFFRALALCHTVLPETNDDILRYNAQSPDEEALVAASRNFGIVFSARTTNTITLQVYDSESKEFVEEVYDVLNILDFDNIRKRMSIIVRDSKGHIRLYCKGADTLVFELISPEYHELKDLVTQQLRFFARDGLRTLVLGYKDLSEEEYINWNQMHTRANLSLDDREEELRQAYEIIEKNIILTGATAIEDKLQAGVPETIASLAKANIKLWVLTGDKQETAINIGYSSHLLTHSMKNVFVIEGNDSESVQNELMTALNEIKNAKTDENQDNKKVDKYGFVIGGTSLKFALDDNLSKLFLEVTAECQAVICCRVTPLQKASVVKLVKNSKKVTTLAIGDGANDVGMILAAHIGVGISGREGQQAVLASDYSFAQFRFLERLVLVHGRWSYLRMSKFLSYFFYKNFAFTWCHVWYGFFNGFSANAVFEPFFITLYNIIFTSLPVILMGILDQDVTDDYLLRFPKLYIAGQKGILFNNVSFFLSLLKGAVVSFLIFTLCFGSYYYNTYQTTGWESDSAFFFFLAISFPLTVVVNIQVGLDMEYWPVLAFIINIGSILSWFIYAWIITSLTLYAVAPFWVSGFGFLFSFQFVLANSTFWLNTFISVGFCILPVIIYRFLKRELRPSLADDVQKQMTKDRTEKSPVAFVREKIVKQRVPDVWKFATGYAFSHEKGFGELIMTGRWKYNAYKQKRQQSKEKNIENN